MKTVLLFTLMIFFSISVLHDKPVAALKGMVASQTDIDHLKDDIRAGRILVGKTRLNDIRDRYGEASNIIDSERKLVYDYGDLKITFEKIRYLRHWEYDSFKKPVYTDDVDDLRFDLESQEIVGDYVRFRQIRRDYGEPTESAETYADGGTSIYYYGNIKLTFENVIVVKSWRGSNLNKTSQKTKETTSSALVK